MTSQQIKSFVALRHVDQITRFESASNEQIVRAYQFTDQLRSVAVQLLSNIVSGKSSRAIVGERGSGKSHMLAFLRSITNQPDLIGTLEDSEASVALHMVARQKIPAEGIPTLAIGFDPDKGLNFVKAYPKARGLEGELPDWLSTDQIDELIEERISNSSNFALFIDGISPLLRNPNSSEALLEWLRYLVTEAASSQFCLLVTLDRDLVDDDNELAKDLCTLFQIERLNMSNFATLIGQTVFRKINQQHRELENLYKDLRNRMPHFTGTPAEFIQLYPVHPIVLEIAPAMRCYARSFSLFGFIKAVSARALVRRAFSLICLDDLFESFEFDLRRNSKLTEIFKIYDHLFSSIIPNFGQQHSLYAKMMLKGLLLLSLAERASTAVEIADAVMLYDDHEPKSFRKVITHIMDRLSTASPGIAIELYEEEPRYLFSSPSENIVSDTSDTDAKESHYTEIHISVDDTQLHSSEINTKLATRIFSEADRDQAGELNSMMTQNPMLTGSDSAVDLLNQIMEQEAQSRSRGKFEQMSEAAAKIADDDLRLDQLLVSAGKKYFKDWPLVIDSEDLFRDRAEINIRWRGSLRKGILKFCGDVEIHSMADRSLDDARPICEFDWQITILRAYASTTALREYAPIMEPPSADIPSTMLYWKPAELTEQEHLTLKHFFIARTEGSQFFDTEQAQSITAASEAEVAQIFARAYLQEGKLLSANNTNIELGFQSSTFINSVLTRLMDLPLTTRYPHHPRFEELLDPEYINDMAAWMFAPDKAPTPDQQMYLEQFAAPLQLVRQEEGKYKLDVRDKEFPPDTAIGQLLEALEKSGSGPLSKPAAYQIVRREPFGLQRPALLLVLAALAADKRITLVDEFGDSIHNDTGLSPDAELSDFSVICIPETNQPKNLSWRNKSRKEMPVSLSADYKDHTILIVDDDPTIHILMEQAAKPLGCHVEKALDGVEALAKLRNMRINLVISDLRMPNMTGVELFYHMRSEPALANIPFIVLSSIEADEESATALESGVEDYWFKPFRVQEVTVRIKRLFRRRMTTTGAYARVAWPNESAGEQPKAEEKSSFSPSTTVLKMSEVNELFTARETDEKQSIKADNNLPKTSQPTKIFPSTAVSRLKAASDKPASRNAKSPPVSNPSLPQIPVPDAPTQAESTRPAAPSQTNDELIIPSIRSELSISTAQMPQFEVIDEENTGSEKRKKAEINNEENVLFTMTISNPEARPIDVMTLYNQFWDSCRRVGTSTTTPEYEDFKGIVLSKANKLKKQFNCDELTFTVEVENGIVHLNCQVNQTGNFLKSQPKFQLF
jgi:DNA-binding response OmpR family regulator